LRTFAPTKLSTPPEYNYAVHMSRSFSTPTNRMYTFSHLVRSLENTIFASVGHLNKSDKTGCSQRRAEINHKHCSCLVCMRHGRNSPISSSSVGELAKRRLITQCLSYVTLTCLAFYYVFTGRELCLARSRDLSVLGS